MTTYSLKRIAEIVKEGGIIAYPTEALWGLGCDPWNERAVLRLLALKQRPLEKGLIVIASRIEQFDFILNTLPDDRLELLKSRWPGPYTWLVPHQQQMPQWVTGEHSTVALRVTNHPTVKALCDLTGPIISTSANISTQPAATSLSMVKQYFDQRIDGILEGALGQEKQPSRICDLATGTVIR